MTGYYTATDCDLAGLEALTNRRVDLGEVPHAAEAPANVPTYDMGALRPMLDTPETRRILMAEWAYILRRGAGVFVLRGAYPDTSILDAATETYSAIIEDEEAQAGSGADHFAAAGSNDRIWNALQKLAEAAPDTYVRYFANPVIDAACEAWLGPHYQMTAQVNLVRPGGQAQQAHRDYHLGFQSAEASAAYPAHIHDLSPLMTLQGGIAHVDTPVEAGPTKLLPFSQLYGPGYVASRHEDIRAHFDARHVQRPLAKGDALFFNPALFHAAGENRSTGIQRLVNLLQVSSAFGRAMETVDRSGLCEAIYPSLLRIDLAPAERHAVVAATAEGYAFPTNLDRDPPIGGLAPQSQAALLHDAITARWPLLKLQDALATQQMKRAASIRSA